MENPLLIISSKPDRYIWKDYVDALASRGIRPELWSGDNSWRSHFRAKGWLESSSRLLIDPEKGKLACLLFFLLAPIAFFSSLALLLPARFSRKTRKVWLMECGDMLRYTFPARLLGMEVAWIMAPGKIPQLGPFGRWRLSRLSRQAELFCFDNNSREILSSQRFRLHNLRALKLALGEGRAAQKNIFQSLAEKAPEKQNRKYFSVGTIAELRGNIEHIETLFQAIRVCVEVIPEIQLIVAGDGPERKRLTWMARKMGISNLVWFVGDKKEPQRWMSGFDLYVSCVPQPELSDILNLMSAAIGKLPLVAANESCYDEYINDRSSGLLVSVHDAEKLARAIIELQQAPERAKTMGQNACRFIEENYRFDKLIDELCA